MRVRWLGVFFFFFYRASRNLGGRNRMRLSISRRKSRTRPSCTREHITGDAHVVRSPHLSEVVARELYWHMYRIHAPSKRAFSVALVRGSLSATFSIAEVACVFYVRARDRGAAAARSLLPKWTAMFYEWPPTERRETRTMKKKNSGNELSVSFTTSTPLPECFPVL